MNDTYQLEQTIEAQARVREKKAQARSGGPNHFKDFFGLNIRRVNNLVNQIGVKE